MSPIGTIINIVLRGENDFCSLCFNIGQYVNLEDEISVVIDGNSVVVVDILNAVFGKEIQEYMSKFENVCEQCFRSIIDSYTFIQGCLSNAKLLKEALIGLTNSIKYVEENENNKSLFVSLDLEYFTSKHTYDTKKLDSAKEALERYKELITPLKKEVIIKKEKSNKVKKKAKRNKTQLTNIKITDMLLDPNDKLACECKVCYRGFRSLWNLRVHYFREHAPNNHKCANCSKAFASASLVTLHQKEQHSEIICSKCGKILKSKCSLGRHEMMHHSSYVCPDCGRSYKTKMTYNSHIALNVCKQKCRADPANAQFTCDYCGKKYTQKMSLRVHIQYVHGNYKPHICDWCGKKFWAQSRLKTHILKHTREKNFTCSTCQGKFVSKESLLCHTRLHTGEKPYKCDECECTFISSSRRARHVKTYHLLGTLQCEICHAKFTSQFYLDKHKKCHKQSQDTNKNDKDIDKVKDLAIKNEPETDESVFASGEITKIDEKLLEKAPSEGMVLY